MYNVVTSFGNYPTNIKLGEPGPYTAEELGLMWLKHCAVFSEPGMLKKYRLVLLLPRDVTIPQHLNDSLNAWGDKKRFDENSHVRDWPLGPNLVFQQVLWLYVHKKLEGPFLWCEPDCIPVKPDWLDRLFDEYERSGKLFMGAFVDAKTESGQRIPRHMTGNGIYPDKPHNTAPGLLEARLTPWDVYAATQIMRNCQFTIQIQHEYRHEEIRSAGELAQVLRENASLFHTDKFGAIIRILGGGELLPADPHESLALPLEAAPPESKGKTPSEVFAEEEKVELFHLGAFDAELAKDHLDDMLELIGQLCASDKEARRKTAYFMLEHGIVNQGFLGQFMRKRQKQRLGAALAFADKQKEQEAPSVAAESTG